MTGKPLSLLPAKWEPADAEALQALERGNASEAQQKRALGWIVRKAAMTFEPHHQGEHTHDTAFGLGRAFVGQQIGTLLSINVPAWVEAEKKKASKK